MTWAFYAVALGDFWSQQGQTNLDFPESSAVVWWEINNCQLHLGPCHPLTSDIGATELTWESLWENQGGRVVPLNGACSEDSSTHSLGIYLSALSGSVTLLTVKIYCHGKAFRNQRCQSQWGCQSFDAFSRFKVCHNWDLLQRLETQKCTEWERIWATTRLIGRALRLPLHGSWRFHGDFLVIVESTSSRGRWDWGSPHPPS